MILTFMWAFKPCSQLSISRIGAFFTPITFTSVKDIKPPDGPEIPTVRHENALKIYFYLNVFLQGPKGVCSQRGPRHPLQLHSSSMS